MDLSWRPIERDQIPQWHHVIVAAEEVDRTGEHYSVEDITEEFDNPDAHGDDRVGAWFDEGGRQTMVEWASLLVRGRGEGYLRVQAEGGTDPVYRGRGVGSQGVARILARAAKRRLGETPDLPARIEMNAPMHNESMVDLLEGHSFEAVNWSAVMKVLLDDGRDLPEPRWPSGITVHPYDRSWGAAMRAAHNEAFLDHWGFTAWSEQMWQQWIDGSRTFRPEVSFVLVDEAAPDEVVAYAQTNEFDAHQAMTGRREAHLAKLGVRRSHRGRGLASGLLRHTLVAYRAAGYDEATLDVDTNNPSGAFGLYQRVGFEIQSRMATYLRTLPPDATGQTD